MTAPTAERAMTTMEETDQRRKLALLKAVGLDRVPVEQRELALAIAKRYDLDLLLKHLVLIDGKPYITRDALLWIAHRSGQFDGIGVTRPVIEGEYWYAEATVYRKDMTHPFTYGGRYPVKGKNATFAPEMATKVAECMALRRAFNVSAPTMEERWDVDVPTIEPSAPATFAEKAAARAEAIQKPDGPSTPSAQGHGEAPKAGTEEAPGVGAAGAVTAPAADLTAAESIFEGEFASVTDESPASPKSDVVAGENDPDLAQGMALLNQSRKGERTR